MRKSNVNLLVIIAAALFILGYSSVFAQNQTAGKIDVAIISDEADCVLNILKKKSENIAITENDWQKLFASEGYVGLKIRENAMKRPFTDSEFKSFVLSDTLGVRMKELEKTLDEWKKVDINALVKLALAYLPDGAAIKTKVFIEIKPKQNSFVFNLLSGPAIFLYMNPSVSKEKFKNTLAHELHHIGYNQNCAKSFNMGLILLSEAKRNVINWIGAFGEGFAMIAAAGDSEINPHEYSSKEDKERWNKDVANFNEDLKKVESFFFDILSGKLTRQAVTDKAMEFFGIQGPWYTVGWKMSIVIEKTYGHKKLLECIIDHRKLLPTFNKAVIEYNNKFNENLCTWSDALIAEITK